MHSSFVHARCNSFSRNLISYSELHQIQLYCTESEEDNRHTAWCIRQWGPRELKRARWYLLLDRTEGYAGNIGWRSLYNVLSTGVLQYNFITLNNRMFLWVGWARLCCAGVDVYVTSDSILNLPSNRIDSFAYMCMDKYYVKIIRIQIVRCGIWRFKHIQPNVMSIIRIWIF